MEVGKDEFLKIQFKEWDQPFLVKTTIDGIKDWAQHWIDLIQLACIAEANAQPLVTLDELETARQL